MDLDRRRVQLVSRLGIIFLLGSVDYVSKALIHTNLSPGQSIPLIGNFLRLTYVQNCTGFSWFVPEMPAWVQTGFQAFLFLLAVIAFPVYLFYTHTRRQTFWTDTSFVCLVSSFLGHSVIDVFFPCTVDFLQVFQSPIANLADLYSYIGIGALLVELAQVSSLKKLRSKDLYQHLTDMINVRKEFFNFIRKGLK